MTSFDEHVGSLVFGSVVVLAFKLSMPTVVVVATDPDSRKRVAKGPLVDLSQAAQRRTWMVGAIGGHRPQPAVFLRMGRPAATRGALG